MFATIAAIATPPGLGGVGIVRVSGTLVREIAVSILGLVPKPRHAVLRSFLDQNHQAIDQGIALFFPAPNSFTGEDVLELHGHGGLVVLDLILQRILSLGAKLAKPGEFTERAYLTGKLDLIQAEAVADLITSSTASAAKASMRTLQGAFSQHVHRLKDQILELRLYLEGALDFVDEDIDWFGFGNITTRLDQLLQNHQHLLSQANQGRLLRDGLNLVIAGAPNAGKSSLLNALTGKDVAIVTPIPGTTRDVLKEYIQLDGMPLHIIDTAGIRVVTGDVVEREGIKRAKTAITQADRVLWLFDDATDPHFKTLHQAELPPDIPLTLVRNKIDLTGTQAALRKVDNYTEIAISTVTGLGLDILRQHLKDCVGFNINEGDFIAHRRHLDAITRALTHVQAAKILVDDDVCQYSIELIAEELRHAQNAIGQITGEITTEDLLTEIFSKFCVGK
jgi:tRNA modification GTPase